MVTPPYVVVCMLTAIIVKLLQYKVYYE